MIFSESLSKSGYQTKKGKNIFQSWKFKTSDKGQWTGWYHQSLCIWVRAIEITSVYKVRNGNLS